MKIVKIPTKKLVWNKSIYPRNAYNWVSIGKYTEYIRNGTRMPPIVVFKRKEKYVIIDGYHRWKAHENAKKPMIEAEVRKYKNVAEAFADAVRLNLVHGDSLNTFETTKAIIRLRELGLDDIKISNIVNIRADKIDKFVMKRSVLVTDEATGQSYYSPLKKSMGHLRKQEIDLQTDVDQLSSSFGEKQVDIIDEVITMLKDKVLNEQVVSLSKLKELLKATERAIKRLSGR